MVASLVGGRYEITGLVASGGMGEVYRARDTVLERIVALKVLRDGDESFRARFRSEATNAARLSHPGIVQVYDFGASDADPFIAMEFVDGRTLRDILQSRTALTPAIAARIVARVGAALEHARRQGVVHRDVKPDNVIVTADGAVKVTDFGLSRTHADSTVTQAGMVMGTAHYLAPEQVTGDRVDHRADLYALGVVLYEMLTGTPPFPADSAPAVAYRRVNEDVPSALGVNPDVPRALDVVLQNLTARDPDERYASAAEMLQDLEHIEQAPDVDLSGLVHLTSAIPIAGQETVALPRRSQRRSRRRSRRRGVAIAVALTLLVGAGYAINGPLARIGVPNVVGADEATAKRALEAEGFTVDEVLQNSATVPAGSVISQDPLGGTVTRSGAEITIVLSLGPRLVEVPNVVGRTYRNAERALSDLGFEVRRDDVYDADVEPLHVVSMDRHAGDLIKEGSIVTLQVSRGPEMVAVPNVVGDPEAAAVDDLEAKGFEVKVERRTSGAVPAGRVISTSPKQGASIEKGSTVRLVVSLGPPLVKVPDLECMTRKQAEDQLVSRGLKVEFSGQGERVVDQTPSPGAKAPKRSVVTAFMSLGSYC